MSPRRQGKPVALGFLSLALLAALLGRSHFPGPKPSGADVSAQTFTGHTSPVRALAFGPDGTTLTSAASPLRAPEHGVELIAWDVPTGSRRATHNEFQDCLFPLALSAEGGTLATIGVSGAVRLWDTTSLAQRARLDEDPTGVFALAFSADGTVLATADHVNRVMLWEASGKRRSVVPNGQAWPAYALAFAPDGRTLAGGGYDTAVRLWDATMGAERGILRVRVPGVGALAFSPDGRVLASGDYRDGVVTLWDVAARTERAILETIGDKDSLNEVAALAFAPDGRMLAVATDRAVQLWDVETARLLARLEGHEGKVKCLAYSPDGTRLASGSYDRTVRLWDVARYR
jgi:WD40 repeat protein